MDTGQRSFCSGDNQSDICGVPISELNEITRVEYIERLPSLDELDIEFTEINKA